MLPERAVEVPAFINASFSFFVPQNSLVTEVGSIPEVDGDTVCVIVH
jgi:hypothetical protein